MAPAGLSRRVWNSRNTFKPQRRSQRCHLSVKLEVAHNSNFEEVV
jgi:hypothetical protein